MAPPIQTNVTRNRQALLLSQLGRVLRQSQSRPSAVRPTSTITRGHIPATHRPVRADAATMRTAVRQVVLAGSIPPVQPVSSGITMRELASQSAALVKPLVSSRVEVAATVFLTTQDAPPDARQAVHRPPGMTLN